MTDLPTIAFAIALAFVLFSVPEMLSKLGFCFDEFKRYGLTSAVILFVKLWIQCLKCCAFGVTWIITGSFTIAGCLALSAYIINRHN